MTLDVREDFRQGREPFGRIMDAVAQLQPDEGLRLLAPFEPMPLFAVLARQGFSHTAQPTAAGDWEVLFHRASDPSFPLQEPGAPSQSACASGALLEVDARGLEPPQPLVRILEALTQLPAGAELRARTDRRPMHLYAQLEARGFRGASEEQSDGSFVTQIRRAET